VKFLLDTNAVIALGEGRGGLEEQMWQYRPENFGLPAVVIYELYYGAANSRRAAENLARVESLPFRVLEFDRQDARAAGEIRVQLERLGESIGPHGLMIAGQAVARDLTLITHNVGEFQRVPGLRLEDWEQG
jgi:tRNA(fMet)-specific endonuclease VapC